MGETKSSNIPSISSNKKKKTETVMDMLDTKRIYSYDQLANNQNFKLQETVLNAVQTGEINNTPFLNVTVQFTDVFQLPTEPDVNPIDEEINELGFKLSAKSMKNKSNKKGGITKTDIGKEKDTGKTKLEDIKQN